MKIAMIGTKGLPATFGGVEYNVQELSRELAALGHDVRVYVRSWYTPRGSVGPAGVRRIWVPTIHTKHLDAAVHSFLSAVLAAAGDADVVHFHALGPNLFSALPRIRGKKIVTTIHRLDYAAEKWGPLARLALRLGERLATVVPHRRIVVSRDLARHFQTRYGKAAEVIPQGSVAPVSRPPDLIRRKYGLEGGDYVLFMGRLSPEKRVDWLIRAWTARAGASQERAPRLVIAGGSSATNRYDAALRKAAAGRPDIIFTGNVSGPEKDELFSNARLFVLPSSIEGLPVVLIEARRYGLCCLASDIPPHREVIRDGEDGRLFGRDSPADLAAALEGLLADRALAERLGRAASRRTGDHPTWKDIALRTLEVYSLPAGGPAPELRPPRF